MTTPFAGYRRIRKNYGKIREVQALPDLIEIQKNSYQLFLKSGSGRRANIGRGLAWRI